MCYMNKPFILNIMSFKNNYLNDSFLYVSPQIFGKILSIFILPVILVLVDKSTYGNIALLLGFQQVISTISSKGSRQTILKFYGIANSETRKKIIKYFNFVNIKRTGIILGVYLVINSFFDYEYSSVLILNFFLGVLFISYDSMIDSILVSTQKAKQNSLVNIVLGVLTPLFLLLLLNVIPTVEIYFISLNLAYFLKILLTRFYTSQVQDSGTETIDILEIKKFSQNMLSINLSQKLIKWSDRIILGIFIGQNSLAEYHAIIQLVLALEFVTNGLTTALKPLVFNNKKSNKSNQDLLNDILKLILLITIMGIALRDNLGTAILPEEYWDFLDLIPFIAISIFITSLFKLFTIFADKDSLEINHIKNSLITTILNILLCLIGLQLFGIIGIIFGGMCSGIIRFIYLLKDKNFKNIPKINFTPIVKLVVSLVILEIVSEFLSYSGAVTLRWFFGSFLSIYIGSVVLKLRTFTSELF